MSDNATWRTSMNQSEDVVCSVSVVGESSFYHQRQLRRSPGGRAESDDQQTASSVERRSPCGQRYPQVRPRLVATPPYRAILTRCSWASRLQARRHGVQLPAWSSASVPRGIAPINRRCRITATSPIRHPTAPSRTAPPAQHLRPTGFLCGWSVGLEFPAGQLAGSGY